MEGSATGDAATRRTGGALVLAHHRGQSYAEQETEQQAGGRPDRGCHERRPRATARLELPTRPDGQDDEHAPRDHAGGGGQRQQGQATTRSLPRDRTGSVLVGAAHGAIMPTRARRGSRSTAPGRCTGLPATLGKPPEAGDTPSTYWAAQRFRIVTDPLTCADEAPGP